MDSTIHDFLFNSSNLVSHRLIKYRRDTRLGSCICSAPSSPTAPSQPSRSFSFKPRTYPSTAKISKRLIKDKPLNHSLLAIKLFTY